MSEPIVFISRNLVREGMRAEFDSLFANAVHLIQDMKPGTSLFAAYVDEGGTEVAIVHTFAGAEAMALHFEGFRRALGNGFGADRTGGLRDVLAGPDCGGRPS